MRRLPLGAEVAFAFAAGAASFTVVAFTVAAAASSDLLVAVLAVLYLIGVAAMLRAWGVAYAVPSAIAALLAFDWFYIPPRHPHEFPDSGNFIDLLVSLAVGVLIGQLAARASRRADVTEVARGELAREQAALRRVATLVAEGVPGSQLFSAVAEETGTLLGVDGTRIARYEGAEEIVEVTHWTVPGYSAASLGRVKLEGASVGAEVLRTRRPARIDDYADIDQQAPWARGLGINSVVGAPIIVEGDLWGVIVAWVRKGRLAEDAEARLTDVTELVGTAIANAEARSEVARLADEQAALRRVATLVARGVSPAEVFSATARELGQLLGVEAAHVSRYEPDGTVLGVGGWSADGDNATVGIRVLRDDTTLSGRVFASGDPERIDDYGAARGEIAAVIRELGIRSGVAAPILVDGRVWGAAIATSTAEEPFPQGTESRIAAFTELVATAISNAEARAEVARLADEQAGLRRVATLVAQEAPPAEVFAKVAEEVGRLIDAETAAMHFYEPDGNSTVVAICGELEDAFPVGTRVDLEGDNVIAIVRRTRRPARLDNYASTDGRLAATLTELGVRSSVGAPIVVDGRLWGAMTAVNLRAEPFPADAESRIEEFTELVATAVSNMQARSDLAASRARIVAAADDERRRVVRDLHDGAQQRLVHTIVTLKLAGRALDDDQAGVAALVEEALQQAEQGTEELRELAHGILPAVLTRGGLRAGVEALAARMAVPGGDRGVGRAAAHGGGGDRLLRGRRGADQRDQALACQASCCHGAGRRRRPRGPGARRRSGGCPARRKRPPGPG